MGLFNGKAQAQLRAQHIAGLIQGLADGNLDQSIGAGDDPIWTPVYDSLARLQKGLRQQQTETTQTEALDRALVEMTRQHSDGWIDEVIPVAQFSGTQARIAKGVNDLVAAHIAVKMQVVRVVTAYGDGDFSQDMDRLPGKKAQITQAIDKVRDQLSSAAQAASENIRIKSALDNCSTNVMIADGERNIIYMNKTVTSMLQNAEADLRKALPSFSVSKLLGGSIDQFHKNPEHQKRLLATFTSTFRAQIEVGGRTFGLVANPVISDSGERLGSVVEWADRTLEVNVEREVAGLVGAAANGDFSKRINEEGKTGFILNLATGLNQLVDTADKGLKDVSRMLGALAKGDLSQSISADYQGTFGELKDYSNETAQSLSRMLGQIREAADTINTAAGEISSGNAELSTRTEQQASSLEETASSMEELTSTVKLNAENARQANSLAVNASEVATEGGNVVQKVVSTMTAINESARKISDIIGVIDGIAFQTNILALNAAVEAARAGEQGRGFAVVAAEVRTLAQRSAAAAKEIKTLISDSVSKVENGNTLVAQAGQTMSDIVIAIKRVTDIMAEIAAASAEQSRGIEEVNGAVNQMDEMTQQNAALVEEAAAAAEALQEQAGLMAQSVAVFKLDPAHAGQPAAAHGATRHKSPARPQRTAGRVGRSKEEEWEEF
ncbi:methyl-accepting chemotaxis protein [Metapseudomonas resinovorans]|uniref:methyl-accepting chemotaxis protein n=1 Tax=Metapseudomonas resinovorans TaxID=53412 RepID=UPI003D1ACA75